DPAEILQALVPLGIRPVRNEPPEAAERTGAKFIGAHESLLPVEHLADDRVVLVEVDQRPLAANRFPARRRVEVLGHAAAIQVAEEVILRFRHPSRSRTYRLAGEQAEAISFPVFNARGLTGSLPRVKPVRS